MAGPSDADESACDDDGPGQGDERLNDFGVSLGTDQEFLEAAVVPRVGALHDPPGSGL